MKKLLMNFADSLLSTEQMKKVRGGYGGGGGQCYLTCNTGGQSMQVPDCQIGTVRQYCGQAPYWSCGGGSGCY